MSKKIGELLIENGLLTPAQLERALKAQLIFGGHLGTNLIELGFLDEDALGRALSELLRLPYAPRELLELIPDEALAALSREQVERHKAIPFKLEENALHVAIVHPRHLGSLSTGTGLKIVPHVAPELRIYEAMERHYGVARRARYLKLCHELDGVEPPRRRDPVPAAPLAAAATRPETPTPPAVATGGDSVADLAMLGGEYGYGRDWREVLEREIDRQQAASVPAEPAGGMPRLVERLGRADGKEDMAAAVLDFAAESLSGSILFGVRTQTAFLWDWRGMALDPARLNSLRFSVTAGSIFTLLLGRDHYRGPVPSDERGERFYVSLQTRKPNEILIVPVYLDDRLVALFYGEESAHPRIRPATEDFLRMAEKLSLTMNMLILKMKIRRL